MQSLSSVVPLIIYLRLVSAFDSDQLEVFDVVEEVKDNFYALLNVSNDATIQEIKSAFRSLSLKLHPDKNLEVDTSVQFRNLVSVYEVLRSSAKRKYYDEVLTNGLPNWRSAVYYYRYVGKMGLIEVCIILFVILTIGQYLVNWAAYLEKKYTLEQIRKTKRKKELVFDELPKPSMMNTLPFQIPCLIWFLLTSIPTLMRATKTVIEEATAAPPPAPPEEAEVQPKIKTVRKRNKGFTLPEGPNFETTTNPNEFHDNPAPSPPVIASGGLWTDDDLNELTRLMKKHPGGTSGRWELIAECMMRSVAEVTYMANKIKENPYKLQSDQEEYVVEIKEKKKTKKDVNLIDDNNKKWSQTQQKIFEEALYRFPRGCLDRWDKVAELVPNKTKEECMMRFKYLAETLKKQKTPSELSDSTTLRKDQ